MLYAGLFVATIAHAAVLYTDLGSDDTYVSACTCGWGIGYNPGAGSAVGWVAAPFTPSSTDDLWRIQIAMTWFYGPDSITINLVNDNGGSPGTTVLESWTMTGLAPWPFSFTGATAPMGPAQTLTSVPGVSLSAGTQYWIVAQPDTNGDNYFVWMPTGLSLQEYVPDGVLCALGCGSNSVQSAPALQVESAPEPSAGVLACSGIALLTLLRVRGISGSRKIFC